MFLTAVVWRTPKNASEAIFWSLIPLLLKVARTLLRRLFLSLVKGPPNPLPSQARRVIRLILKILRCPKGDRQFRKPEFGKKGFRTHLSAPPFYEFVSRRLTKNGILKLPVLGLPLLPGQTSLMVVRRTLNTLGPAKHKGDRRQVIRLRLPARVPLLAVALLPPTPVLTKLLRTLFFIKLLVINLEPWTNSSWDTADLRPRLRLDTHSEILPHPLPRRKKHTLK